MTTARTAAESAAFLAAQQAARESFGRLLSWLAWQWRDIAAAEDALSDALLKALERWPVDGVPAAPDAWLLAVAKRQLLQMARHDKVRFDPAVAVLLAQEQSSPEVAATPIPDARLKLMFVCAHPAIDEKIRTALMLQTVLGLQASDIAPAMLTSPATLAQRLVRAKQKIRATELRFEEPDTSELPQRLHYVLEAIYAAFGLSVDAVDGAENRVIELQQEALFLGNLVVQVLPDSAEAKGLLALMLFRHARSAAQYRRVDFDTVSGTVQDADMHQTSYEEFIPLAEQDTKLWDRAAILQADQLLWSAAQYRQAGMFQLEAAIQSAHCHRLFSGSTPWAAIAQLYRQVNQHFPTIGAQVAGAVALAEAGQVAAGIAQLKAITPSEVQSFQPWWVATAHLLSLMQKPESARTALQTAIGLTKDRRLQRYLRQKSEALDASI